MGRVIKREVVAIRCELATPRRGTPRCDQVAEVWPVTADSVWQDQVQDLARLVDAGWGVVLLSTLRSYCPSHAGRVWDCTCVTNPDRKHLCTSHGATAELVWTLEHVPAEALMELERIGVAA